ncbi:MAG: class I SAM-dependent methyltransferase [Tissierellia bacterium]|nr:class I SAM-dependent methyltransferase [Tissierellia bacterium]
MRKFRGFFNVNDLAKFYIESYIKPSSKVLDLTLGNGKDALNLVNAIGDDGTFYGFDIQNEAIEKSRKLLESSKSKPKIILINECHSKVRDIITENIDFAIMNLGFMPGGDKTIITKPKTTIKCIECVLKLMSAGAFFVISSYIGHDGGDIEQKEIDILLKNINQKDFNIIKFTFHNQKNSPAIFYSIERKNEEYI